MASNTQLVSSQAEATMQSHSGDSFCPGCTPGWEPGHCFGCLDRACTWEVAGNVACACQNDPGSKERAAKNQKAFRNYMDARGPRGSSGREKGRGCGHGGHGGDTRVYTSMSKKNFLHFSTVSSMTQLPTRTCRTGLQVIMGSALVHPLMGAQLHLQTLVLDNLVSFNLSLKCFYLP